PADRRRGDGAGTPEARLRAAGPARDPDPDPRRDPVRSLRRATRGGAERGRPRALRRGTGRGGERVTGSTVAVTGATGFLGRYVVDALLARGARVVGVVRNPGRVPALAARGVEMRRADLGDRAALAAGFRGADAVVSNAALFSLGNRRWEDHERANVRATENVFPALGDAGGRRAVHVSSRAVHLARHPPSDDNTPQRAPP